MYAHVTDDGSVDYLGALPKSWGNVSNLHLSNGNDAYLKTIGWVPLVETNVTPTANQTFDTDVITAEEDRVTLVHRVRDMTAEEIAERDASHMGHLRGSRDEKLVASDWTLAADYPAPLADAKKAEWSTYRQSLRDLPETESDVSNPTWPAKPE